MYCNGRCASVQLESCATDIEDVRMLRFIVNRICVYTRAYFNSVSGLF